MSSVDSPTGVSAVPNGIAPGANVLIVDDQDVIRRIANLALSGAGWTVAEARDAAEAIAAVESADRPFDLVLLDLTLPDGQGTRIIPIIRQRGPATRVLVVSGLGELEAVTLGADGYLAKPFTRSTLISAVERTLPAGSPNPAGSVRPADPG